VAEDYKPCKPPIVTAAELKGIWKSMIAGHISTSVLESKCGQYYDQAFKLVADPAY
jgi:hypothetical protein